MGDRNPGPPVWRGVIPMSDSYFSRLQWVKPELSGVEAAGTDEAPQGGTPTVRDAAQETAAAAAEWPTGGIAAGREWMTPLEQSLCDIGIPVAPTPEDGVSPLAEARYL